MIYYHFSSSIYTHSTAQSWLVLLARLYMSVGPPSLLSTSVSLCTTSQLYVDFFLCQSTTKFHHLPQSTATNLSYGTYLGHLLRDELINPVKMSVRPYVRPQSNSTQPQTKWWNLLGSTRHSRPYDFQGHPRSGSRSRET